MFQAVSQAGQAGGGSAIVVLIVVVLLLAGSDKAKEKRAKSKREIERFVKSRRDDIAIFDEVLDELKDEDLKKRRS